VVAELSPAIVVSAAPLGVVFVVLELSPEAVVWAAAPEVAFVVLELYPEVVVWVAVPESASVVVEPSPEVAVLAVAPGAAYVSEPQAAVDIAVAFVVLAPVSVAVAEVDSSGRPKSLAFPNVDHFASSSSSVEVAAEESVHSPTFVHTTDGPCSILSNLGLHQNKNWEHFDNNPSPGHNNGSDTNLLPIDATTSHPRRRGLHQCREQRRHTSPVSLLTPAVRRIR
jgi:hypothetical protein